MKKLLIYSLVLFCISCRNTEKTEPKLSDFYGKEIVTHRNHSGIYHNDEQEGLCPCYLGFINKDGEVEEIEVSYATFYFYKDGDIILCDSTKN